MPLLTPGQNLDDVISPLNRQVTRLRRASRSLVDNLIRQWESDFDLLWSNQGGVTPAQRLAELGTDGGELFSHSTALVTFLLTELGSQDPDTSARIQAKVASMPAITVNQNGTVSIG